VTSTNENPVAFITAVAAVVLGSKSRSKTRFSFTRFLIGIRIQSKLLLPVPDTWQPAGAASLLVLLPVQNYESKRRRSIPATPKRPVPRSTNEDGSGTAGGVIVPPVAPTLPVFPVTPEMSERKKIPFGLAPLAMKFETFTPAASVTVNDNGPGFVTEAPGPQLMPAQETA
jgi:hypothetical protein